MIKKCAYCSKDFTPRNLNRKYCSEECSKRAERDKDKLRKRKHTAQNPVIVSCVVCGKPFAKKAAVVCCSKACSAEHKKLKGAEYRKAHAKNHDERICPVCGTKFIAANKNNRYCSSTCKKKYRAVRDLQRAKERFANANAHPHLPKICPTCGVQFTPHHNHQKYCSVACRPKKIYVRKVRTIVKKPAPQPVSKICPICGQPFETFSTKRKYCSAQCSHQADIILKRKSRAKYRANSRRSSQPRTLSEYEKRSLQFTGSILSDNKTLKTTPILLTVKPTPTPIQTPPKREIIIPAAVAENRQPTVNELLDWIFQSGKP